MKEKPPTGGWSRGKILGISALLLIVVGIGLSALATWQFIRPFEQKPIDLTENTPASTATSEHSPEGKLPPSSVPQPQDGFPAIPAGIVQSPVSQRAASDFEKMYAANPPVHDYFATAEELGRTEVGERTVRPVEYRIGERTIFQTADGPREAELVYMDELAAYWVEIGLSIDRSQLAAAAERFRNDYYPVLSRHYGQEWRPGVDGDLRFTVLHVLGASDTFELGYFMDENQYPRSLFTLSNEREMFYLNMAQLKLGTSLYDGTLVHETQHLIQWNLDANEDKWVNEGLSQIAETIVGLNTVDPLPYLEQTDIRLDRWTEFAPEIHARYAGAYLYLLYLREQAGDAALSELARHPANGLAAVRSILAGYLPGRSLESFTADWAAALFLDGKSADPRYSIEQFELPRPFFANRARQLPFATTSTIEQVSIDYIDLDIRGPATITFAGDTVTPLFNDPPGGGIAWFAPPVNSGRSQLIAAVDLTGLTSAALTFSTWYDLEPLYDFAHLSVSADNGVSWRVLQPNHAIIGAYGPGWGGRSSNSAVHDNGWAPESISLDRYAGRSILLRFDVITDFEEFGRGFALHDLNIPQLTEQPLWRPNGFVETGAFLPQHWEVRLIREGNAAEVIPLALDELNRARVTLDLGSEGGVLAIMPLTPFVESPARYWLSVEN